MEKIIAAGGLIINENQEFLLIFRRNNWDLPKGKLDEGETIEQCAVREVKEEVGLQQVELGTLICKTYHIYFDKWLKKEVEKETWWYVMKTSSNELLTPQKEEDIEQIIWVKKEDLEKYFVKTYPSIKEVFENYFTTSFS